MKYLKLAIRIIIAIILVQTLRFKFTAHPDSVYIFTQVGLEPYGRIAIGIAELVAAILILVPRTAWFGSMMVIGIIGGAIAMHFTKLGISIKNDNGLLFYTAIVTFFLALLSLWFARKDIPFINKAD